MAEAAGALDPQGEIPSVQMAAAVATYLSFRRDEVDEEPRGAPTPGVAGGVRRDQPPPVIASWLEEQGVA